MNIDCSAGKGVMDHFACLSCAATNQNVCGMHYTLLRSLYAGEQDRPRIHVSDLTSCPRKAYLQKINPVPEKPHQMIRRYLGSSFHEMIEKTNGRNGEMFLEVDGVVGTCDFFEGGHLVDYKTTKGIYPHLLPYGEHTTQINLYAFMLELLGYYVSRLSIQYIAVVGGTDCSKCRIPMEMNEGEVKCPNCGHTTKSANIGAALVDVEKEDPEVIEEIFYHRRDTLQDALDNNQLPIGEPGWICKYCPFECDMRQA